MHAANHTLKVGMDKTGETLERSDTRFLHLISVTDKQRISLGERQVLALFGPFAFPVLSQEFNHARTKLLRHALAIEKLKMSFDLCH